MAMNKTSIEIEAKGEFNQLTRGLRDVKSTLGEVTRLVNTGARSGGFFSDKQVKALDIFARRMANSMNEMNRLIDEQGERIVSLYQRKRAASASDVLAIDKEIKKQGEKLDLLEKEREELEKIYRLRKQEAASFARTSPATPSSASTGAGGSSGAGGSAAAGGLAALGKGVKGIGGIVAKVAGVALTISQVMKWEQMAEQDLVAWQPLLQRTNMSRGGMNSIGMQRGYNSGQTQQMLDVYTQTAGNISANDAGRMMDFSRGYGVDANTTAGVAGQMSVRGYGGAGQVLGMAAGVAESSGMQARVLEVLETSQAFLQSMDKNLKDNSGNNLLAYTARINQIGMANGASKLTGSSGASMLEQMGSNVFDPGNVRWQTMGIQMLNQYGGKETKGKDTFELMKTWQEGFQNPTNMRVLGEYMANATKGMSGKQGDQYKTLVMQEAMGGGTTFGQAEQFGKLTNWLKSFDPKDPKMSALLAGGNTPGNTKGVGASGDISGNVGKWAGTIAATIEVSNAKWTWAQIQAGEVVIPAKLALQDFGTDMLSQATDALNGLDIGAIIGDKIKAALANVDLWDVVGTVAALVVAKKILSAIGSKAWATLTGTKPPVIPPPGTPTPGAPGAPPRPSPTGPLGKALNIGKSALKWGGRALGAGSTLLGADMAMNAADAAGDFIFGHEAGQKQIPGLFDNPFSKKTFSDSRDPVWERAIKSFTGNSEDQKDQVSKTMTSMQTDSTKTKDMVTQTQQKLQAETTKTMEQMRTRTDAMVKSVAASAILGSPNGAANIKDPAEWYKQFDPSNISTWYNSDPASAAKNAAANGPRSMQDAIPQNEVQQRVKAELEKQGLSNWWPTAQTLLDKESSGGHNIAGRTDPKDGQTPAGYFQFKPKTWDGHMAKKGYGGSPMDYSPEIQTQAMISYVTGRYGDIFSMAKRTGLNEEGYHGYANGTYVARDQTANIHAGEEVIGRAKTSEVLRKTGKLPSQLLNSAMGGTGASAGGSGGTQRLEVAVSVDLGASGSALSGLQVSAIEQIARQIFSDAAHQMARQQVQF